MKLSRQNTSLIVLFVGEIIDGQIRVNNKDEINSDLFEFISGDLWEKSFSRKGAKKALETR